MKNVFARIIALLFLSQSGIAQTITVEQYVQQHKDFAIREMKRMGVPAAITLAQGILETESGNSELVKKSNNHFGIKCKSTWNAGGVSHDDDARGECFRVYKDAEGSYRDHSNFLRGSDRYAFLFKLDPKDYRGWAYGLKKAGYATNPRYPEILIKNIEDNNLQQYTLMAADQVPVFDASKYKSDPEEKNYPVDTASEALPAAGNETPEQQQFENRLLINGSAAILAKKNTSLLAIATENNINLLKLLEYNDLDKDGLLEKDQYIFLDKKSKEGEKVFYTVQQNESLYDVAQKNGIKLKSLCDYNALDPNSTLYAGMKLNLKPGTLPGIDSYPAATERQVTDQVRTHSVQPREGLYTISKKYGITITQIKQWNNLPDDNVKVGQQLIISK